MPVTPSRSDFTHLEHTSTHSLVSYSRSSIAEHSDDEDEEFRVDSEPQYRNIFVRDASSSIVARAIQRGHITISTFYRWLDMILVACKPWYLSTEDSNTLVLSRSDNNVLPLGTYNTIDEGAVYVFYLHEGNDLCNIDGVSIRLSPKSFRRIRRIYSRGEQTPPTSAVRDILVYIMKITWTKNRTQSLRSASLVGTNCVA